MRSENLQRLLALTVVGAIALPAATASANVEVGLTAGPHTFNKHSELGVQDRDDAESLRNSVLFGLRLGFTFTDMFGIEAEAGVIPSEGRNVVFDVWTAVARAHVIAQFGAANPAHKVIPFVVAGGGAITVLKTANETALGKDTDPMVYVGAGAKYRVENGWGLRLDLRGLAGPSSKIKHDANGDPVLENGQVVSDNAMAFDMEVLLSVYKEFGRKAAPKKEIVKEPPPVVDTDGDGLDDDHDQCKDQAEDLDGFQDDDGCPDADNDNDGIADDADQCKDEAEDLDGFQDDDGCPDADNDSDGILDSADMCKDQAEDADGFQDDDGCPDPDNDGDGVLDAQDQCADQAETKNGFKDDDGCADEIPAAVKKFTGVIQGINFKKNSADIMKTSFKVLDAAVKVLKDYPDLRMEISGHTDDTGDHDKNMDLSQRRADSVKAYFVGKGVEETRLVSKGYGPDKPLDPAKTKKARAKNRRVEFQLLSSLDQAAPATPAAP